MGCWVGALSTLVGKIDPTLVTLEARGFRGHLNSKPDRFAVYLEVNIYPRMGAARRAWGFVVNTRFSSSGSHLVQLQAT